MPHHHDEPRTGEHRLEEPAADEVRRRLLDEHPPAHVPVRLPVGGEPRAVLVGDERRVLGEVGSRVEPEPPRAAVRAGGPVDGLEVLPLVLRNARVAKAARVGMLGEAAVQERRAAAVEPPDEDEGLAVERPRHTGTRTCRRARRSSFVDGSGSGTRAISR